MTEPTIASDDPLTANHYRDEAARLLRASARQDDANPAAATLRAVQSIAGSLLANNDNATEREAAIDTVALALAWGAEDETRYYRDEATRAVDALIASGLAPGRSAVLAREGSA